jgi:hypothetical protein
MQLLDKHRQKYSEWLEVGNVIHLSDPDKEAFLELARTFNPNYTYQRDCLTCEMEMLDYCYMQSNLLENIKKMRMTFPKAEKDGDKEAK